MQIPDKWGGLVVKELISTLGVRINLHERASVMVNIGMLIKHFLST
jgi:hypothetical protein